MSGGWSGSPTVDVGKMRRAIEDAVAAERDRCAATIRRVKNDLQLPLSVSDLKILDEIGSAQQ
jgi:hypothetical protein